jgi:hypothetical protein
VEVRKGSGRSGLASEYNLRTPETPDASVRYSDEKYRTPVTGVLEEKPDIYGQITGHPGQEQRTFRVETPDTHVLPSDPDQQIWRSDPGGAERPSDPAEEDAGGVRQGDSLVSVEERAMLEICGSAWDGAYLPG